MRLRYCCSTDGILVMTRIDITKYMANKLTPTTRITPKYLPRRYSNLGTGLDKIV